MSTLKPTQARHQPGSPTLARNCSMCRCWVGVALRTCCGSRSPRVRYWSVPVRWLWTVSAMGWTSWFDRTRRGTFRTRVCFGGRHAERRLRAELLGLLLQPALRVLAHLLGDLHRAEARPAHGAEGRDRRPLLRQGCPRLWSHGTWNAVQTRTCTKRRDRTLSLPASRRSTLGSHSGRSTGSGCSHGGCWDTPAPAVAR